MAVVMEKANRGFGVRWHEMEDEQPSCPPEGSHSLADTPVNPKTGA